MARLRTKKFGWLSYALGPLWVPVMVAGILLQVVGHGLERWAEWAAGLGDRL